MLLTFFGADILIFLAVLYLLFLSLSAIFSFVWKALGYLLQIGLSILAFVLGVSLVYLIATNIIVVLAFVKQVLPYILIVGIIAITIFFASSVIKLFKNTARSFVFIIVNVSQQITHSSVNFFYKPHSRRLIRESLLCNKKIGIERCIFVPEKVTTGYSKKTAEHLIILGAKIDLVEEKIEQRSYPVRDLKKLSKKSLYQSFKQNQNSSDVVQGILLLNRMATIRHQKLLPILNEYKKLANNCRRDSDQILNRGEIQDEKAFKEYRDELYLREKRLVHLNSSEWQNIVDKIYQAIKLADNCFVVNPFQDLLNEIEGIEGFLDECDVSKELYKDLAYRSIY